MCETRRPVFQSASPRVNSTSRPSGDNRGSPRRGMLSMSTMPSGRGDCVRTSADEAMARTAVTTRRRRRAPVIEQPPEPLAIEWTGHDINPYMKLFHALAAVAVLVAFGSSDPAFAQGRGAAANYPAPTEADFAIRDFTFGSGGKLPTLNLHYRTIGTPRRDASIVVPIALLLLLGTA